MNTLGTVGPLLRDALRALRGNPGSSLLVVLALALGIGATTAVFGVVDAVLFRSLGVERPEELVRVVATDEKWTDYSNQSFPVYSDYRDQADAFSSLAAYTDSAAVHLSVNGRTPERITGALVTADFFDVLELRPAAGRLLRPDDDRAGAPPVLVLSDRTFERRFGGDPDVVGSVVRVNGHPMTVVGVAPRGFLGVGLDSLPELWIPIVQQPLVEPEFASDDPLHSRRISWLDVIGRLRPGASLAQAQAQLDVIATRRAASQPEGERDPRARVLPASEALLDPTSGRTTRRIYWLLLGVAALVMLIASADAAGLLLARGERRQREIAIKMAVGASRARVVAQLLAESLVLAGGGAALGALLAAWGTDWLVSLVPPEVALPVGAATPVLESRVLGVAVATALLTGLVAALGPALRASRPSLLPALRDEAGTTAGSARASLRSALVVGQVALSCVLLAGAGLLVRTLLNLNRVDPGFRADGLLLASFDLARQGYEEERGSVVHARLLEAVSALPGVEKAALVRSAPVQSSGMRVSIEPEGYTPAPGEFVNVDYNVVSPGYFETLGLALLRGRDFLEGDGPKAPPVAVVNRALAERYWPGRDPIGKRLGDVGPASRSVTVVGLVGDAKMRSLREEPVPAVYVTLAQAYLPRMTLLVRTRLGVREAVASARAAVAGVDPELPLFRVRTLDEQLAVSLARERLLAALFTGFGLLALVLSGAGLYGLVSFVTAARTREIGVRMALGAQASDVVRLVLGRSLQLAALGAALGLAAAVASARLLSSLLYGVRTVDTATLAAAGTVALAAGVAAGHLPARRAARIEPMAALRHD